MGLKKKFDARVQQSDNHILVIHTMTISDVDYQVWAQFIHGVSGEDHSGRVRLLARKIRITLHTRLTGNNINKRQAYRLNAPSFGNILKRNSGLVKHHVRTLHVDSSSNKSNPLPNQVARNEAGPIALSMLKQQPQQPVVQVVAPLQQVQNAQELRPEIQTVQSKEHITVSSTNQNVMTWLIQNRFQKFMEVFQNFNGHDLLRLSRNDVLQICGEADGIRFFNVLHDRAITPRSKIYVCKSNSNVFHAVFLSSIDKEDLKQELCNLVGLRPSQVQEIYMEGPNNIHIIVCNSVIYHIKEESAFTILILKEKLHHALLLKPIK